MAALLADMAYEAKITAKRPLSSIFFGGGTPSLMPPKTVESLIKAAARHWDFASDVEITLEANPSSVESSRFADLALAGINRVSLGLQALDDKALHFLGRAHSVDESLAALATAQAHFDRVNIDLIYARPGHSIAAWQSELARAIGFGTGHMSLYQLTIEPGTRFASDVAKGDLIPLDDDSAADLYDITQAQMGAAGLPAYEISNHARPGQESRHNLIYWRYQDYVGIGPGAHGRRNGAATVRHKKPENFLSAIDRNQNGIKEEENLTPKTQVMEALLMGLRLAEGVDNHALSDRFSIDIADMLDLQAVDKLGVMGFVHRDGDVLKILPKGMPLLDAILPQIVAVEPEAVT